MSARVRASAASAWPNGASTAGGCRSSRSAPIAEACGLPGAQTSPASEFALERRPFVAARRGRNAPSRAAPGSRRRGPAGCAARSPRLAVALTRSHGSAVRTVVHGIAVDLDRVPAERTALVADRLDIEHRAFRRPGCRCSRSARPGYRGRNCAPAIRASKVAPSCSLAVGEFDEHARLGRVEPQPKRHADRLARARARASRRSSRRPASNPWSIISRRLPSAAVGRRARRAGSCRPRRTPPTGRSNNGPSRAGSGPDPAGKICRVIAQLVEIDRRERVRDAEALARGSPGRSRATCAACAGASPWRAPAGTATGRSELERIADVASQSLSNPPDSVEPFGRDVVRRVEGEPQHLRATSSGSRTGARPECARCARRGNFR